MAQLMGQRHNITEGAVEVGEHPALPSAGDTAVKGAAHLAVAGIEVDPRLVEGTLHHVVKLAVEATEDAQQIVLGILCGVLLVALAHGGEQLVPRQAVLVAQRLALGPQILPELGQILIHGPQQGIQRLPLHAALIQGLIQRGGIAPDLALVDDLQLDAVEGIGHGVLDLVIARQLRLIGALADGGIGIVGQIADGGQVGDAAVVLHLHAAGEVIPQALPRRSTGDVHPGEQLLLPVGEQVLAVPADGLQQEAIGLQRRVGVHDGIQILQLRHRPAQGGVGGGAAAKLGAELVAQTVGLGIGGVGAAPKAAEDEELVGQLLHPLLHLQEAMHQLAVLHARRLTGQCVHRRNGLVQCLHIPGKRRVVKILVKDTQIPYLVHVRSSCFSDRRLPAGFSVSLYHTLPPVTTICFREKSIPRSSTPGDVWFHIAPSSALVGMDRILCGVVAVVVDQDDHATVIPQRHSAVLRPLAAGEGHGGHPGIRVVDVIAVCLRPVDEFGQPHLIGFRQRHAEILLQHGVHHLPGRPKVLHD